MHTTAPALPVELPPHHLPIPRVLAALAVTAVVAASALVGVAAPAAAEGENVLPIAVDDAYSTAMSTQLVVANPGFLANDVDPDSTLTLLSINSAGIAGTVFANNGGGFTYNPTPGFTGPTSFQYRAMEVGTNQFSDWATVTITVDPPVDPNTAPATVADTYTTPYETPLVVSAAESLLLNDSDPDGDPIIALSGWAPSTGMIWPASDQGTFTFTPDPGFSGDVTFTYRAFDHKAQGNLVTVTITVLPPVEQVTITANDDVYPVTAGSAFSVTAGAGVLANDVHSAGQPLTMSSWGEPQGAFAMHLDGSFEWEVPADACGTETFIYEATSGGVVSNPATVTLLVGDLHGEPVPCDPIVPTIAADDDLFFAEPGQTITVPASWGLLANDQHSAAGVFAVVQNTDPADGAFQLASDGSFQWTAPADFCGTLTFTYVAGDGVVVSDPATVTLQASISGNDVECDIEMPGDETGSPTIPTLPSPTEPTEPETPSGDPDLTDQPATPGRDSLAYTGAAEVLPGIGWGALLALMLGLVAPRIRGSRGRA